MTRDEIAEAIESTKRLIPPRVVTTTVNGETLETWTPVAEFEETLPTVIGPELRPTKRNTAVLVYEIQDDEPAMLYEMGIPVVETGDRFHVNVEQKVPLNMDRDNVPPSYLRTIRTFVLNRTHKMITEEDATQTWVREAASDKRASKDAIRTTIVKRFGDDAVAYDPSDLEANKIAASEGRQVIYGGSLSKGEWENVKRTEDVLLPSGQVTPSPKPYSENGDPLNRILEDRWTDPQKKMVAFIRRMAVKLIDRPNLPVVLTSDISWPVFATYGRGSDLVINVGRVGHEWFDSLDSENLGLIIHEFTHEFESDHLSRNFYHNLQRLGGKMTRLALDEPELFRL